MAEKSLKKNAFYSVLKSFLTLFFPLITFPYASRILLPDGIGKVNFANSIISYFMLLGGLGIDTYATREASKIRDNKYELSKFVREILIINLISDFISYLLFIICLFTIQKFEYYRIILLIISVKIFISTLGVGYLYTAVEDFRYITIRSFFFQLLSLIYLFVFVKKSKDINHYAIFGILTSVGSNIYNFIHLRKYIDFRIKIKYQFKKHLKPIFTFFIISCVTSIYSMLDTSMLGFLSDDTQTGYYSAAIKLSHMILGMLTAITGILLPRLSFYNQKNDSNNFNNLCLKSFNIIILLAIPMIFGLISLAKPLMLLLSGKDFLPAIPTMILISPIILIISLNNLMGVQMLPSLNKEKLSLVSYIIGAILNVISNLILIPKLGANGAAIGTLIAEFSVCIFQFSILSNYFINKNSFINFIQSFCASIFMFFLIKILQFFIYSPIYNLLFSFLLGILIYSIFLLIFKNNIFKYYTKILLNILQKDNHE